VFAERGRGIKASRQQSLGTPRRGRLASPRSRPPSFPRSRESRLTSHLSALTFLALRAADNHAARRRTSALLTRTAALILPIPPNGPSRTKPNRAVFSRLRQKMSKNVRFGTNAGPGSHRARLDRCAPVRIGDRPGGGVGKVRGCARGSHEMRVEWCARVRGCASESSPRRSQRARRRRGFSPPSRQGTKRTGFGVDEGRLKVRHEDRGASSGLGIWGLGRAALRRP